MDKVEIERRKRVVIDEWDGIYPIYEAFYIHSIIYSAERAELAFRRYDSSLSVKPHGYVFACLQEALTHAGGLSKFFWPTAQGGELARTRAKKLRNSFAVEESSPLRQRGLRNALEHYDERLDVFLLEDLAGEFFPSPIIAESVPQNSHPQFYFKRVNRSAKTCTIMGEHFAFEDIRFEVNRILALATKFDSDGGRLD
jgi:hypothetical protein